MGPIARRRRRREAQRDEQERLDALRALAEEDVVELGEQLARLDAEVAGWGLDDETRADHRTAVDAHDTARRAVPLIATIDDCGTVNDTLATARFALACVRARLAGDPLPERRTMCFFDPRHGPSVSDVTWTAPGRGTKVVPACAQDAARIADGERPDLRRVRKGGQVLSVWDSADYLPYGQTFYTTGVLTILGQNTDGGSGGMNTMGMGPG